MKFFRKMDNLCGMITKAERITAAVILLVMFIICFMAVILRYVFNSPWTWSDEVILIMLVAFGYLCISIDVYNDEHVALTGIYNRLPPTAKKVLDALRHILICAFFLLMTYYGGIIFKIKYPKKLAATGFSQGIVFFFQMAMAALMCLFCIVNLIKVFVPQKPQSAEEKEVCEP